MTEDSRNMTRSKSTIIKITIKVRSFIVAELPGSERGFLSLGAAVPQAWATVLLAATQTCFAE